MERKFKGNPPRLKEVFQTYDPPLYFVTICTLVRRNLLDCHDVHDAFRKYAERGRQFGIGVGRYVIMPDHIHVFVRMADPVTLSRWVKGLKRALDAALVSRNLRATKVPNSKLSSFWQPGAFDHLMRYSESYAAKWRYVRNNPVRAGLVKRAEDWPFQGEIVVIDRV